MSQVQNTCSEEPASYRLLGAGVTASYRLLGAGVMDDGRLEGWDWIVKVNPSISCFQTVRMRGCVIEICQILKLNCELNIKGQCKERCRDQAHAALYQPHSNQDGQCWTLEEEEVVGMKILTSEWFALCPILKAIFRHTPLARFWWCARCFVQGDRKCGVSLKKIYIIKCKKYILK